MTESGPAVPGAGLGHKMPGGGQTKRNVLGCRAAKDVRRSIKAPSGGRFSGAAPCLAEGGEGSHQIGKAVALNHRVIAQALGRQFALALGLSPLLLHRPWRPSGLARLIMAGGRSDGSRDALECAAALLDEVQPRLIALEALAALIADAGNAEEVDPRLLLCFTSAAGWPKKPTPPGR